MKTEHAGAKNGGGSYGKRAAVKHEASRRRRREAGRHSAQPGPLDRELTLDDYLWLAEELWFEPGVRV